MTLAVVAVAIALRAGPLHRSPYPFNPDGIVYSGHVRIARATGQLPLWRMPTDDYLFTALLTVASEVTGTSALYLGQPAIAVIGSLPVVLIVGTIALLTGHLGWPRRHRVFAAILGGAVLAVDGVYLHRSMAVDEQTVGLFLVPLAAVALARADGTGDRRWYAALVLLLVALPPTHNLDSVVIGLFLTLWASVALARRGLTTRTTFHAALTLGYWTYVGLYNHVVAAVTPSEIVQASRLTDVPALVLAWVILVAIAVPWVLGRSRRAKVFATLATLTTGFVVVAVNAVTPIFPAMPATPRTVLVLSAPLAVIAALASLAVNDADRVPLGRSMLLLVGAVAVITGVSLTAALTPPYLATLYRVQTFLHFPVVALGAVGATVLLRNSPRVDRPVTRSIVAVMILVCAAVSIPIAFGGLDLLVYTGTTTPAELAASGHPNTFIPGPWTTDDHLTRITSYFATNSTVVPRQTYAFLAGGPPPACPVLSQHSWTTVGGQAYPSQPIRLQADRYEALLTHRDVVYSGGDVDRIHLTLPRAGATHC